MTYFDLSGHELTDCKRKLSHDPTSVTEQKQPSRMICTLILDLDITRSAPLPPTPPTETWKELNDACWQDLSLPFLAQQP
mmetsp:Transcript_936/g.1180  ORF Transcript_936/g.1180 Transcript_936/m.1180 type:complete len:80 (-) Transcript_936:2641-2880(-)